MERKNDSISWIKTGALCGLAGGLMYFSAAFIPMPDLAVYIAAFSFGPLLAIGCAGLYYFLADTDRSPRLQIALAAAIAGGVTVLIMLTVQQSIFGVTDKSTVVDETTFMYLKNGINSVHWGMDVAWDILICTATILFSWSMIKKSGPWKLLGVLGLISGSLLLSFNLFYFPEPPASVGSIDWGPLVAIWFLVVFIVLAVASRKI